MNPDLTPIQTITIGVTIAVVTLLLTVFLLTLIYAYKVRHFLEQIGILRAARFPRTDFRTAPFPRHYVEQPIPVRPIWVRQTRTAVVTLERHTQNVIEEFTELPTNREDIPRNAIPGPSNTRRTPTPEPEPVPTEHLRVTNPDDSWGPPVTPAPNDPNYPAGTWSSATEHERFRNWDQPVVVLDTPFEPESFDPVPPYFTARALLAPRAREREFDTSFQTGLPEQQRTIPFPVTGGIRL
ncbi:hypothetical protein EDD85DRAFT_954744 [Armillaria nabsnona]|nr:hypothetical protein EDD85DRAFT_954744 [Armillaria nabsnona]